MSTVAIWMKDEMPHVMDMGESPILVSEAAKILGVTGETIRSWIKAGHLRGYRLSPHRTFVDADELASLVGTR